MILEHYSRVPLGEVRAIEQTARPMSKPVGLWLSVAGEHDWPSWCQNEDFEIDKLAWRTEFTLAASANVLLLKDCSELLRFHDEFASPDRQDNYHSIEWGRVAARYDGIIIAPYQWSLRLDDRVLWYYTWDCASGCIWNPGALVIGASAVAAFAL